LLKAQEKERNWLKNQLRSELHQLRTLETNDLKMKRESADNSADMQEKAKHMKELNDKRAMLEERKAMEAEARQKLEKEIAKQEFHKAHEELKKKAVLNAQKEREAYERQVRNAEEKRQAEAEKACKREEAHEAQESKKKDMRAQDLKRTELMEGQKQQFNVAMGEKKELRDLRIYKSMENNQDIERKRRDDFEHRQRHEQSRDERLAQQRAEDQEAAAKRSFQLMMRRKMIQDQAAMKAEDHRNGILSEQEGKESRLLEHEQKKERYLDFKHELDGLRLKNKEINVERQRRKEEAARESIAEDVRKKDEKMEWMLSERKRLWQIRRATQTEAYRAREIVKNEIMRQRVKSQFKTDDLAKHVESHLTHDLFNPKILQTSSSMPALRAAVDAHQRSMEIKSQDDGVSS